MSEQAKVTGPLPVVSWLKLPEGADPYLEGHKCRECGAIYLGTRENCSSCGARDKMTATKLSTKGKLYSYSIVHRSFPDRSEPRPASRLRRPEPRTPSRAESTGDPVR